MSDQLALFDLPKSQYDMVEEFHLTFQAPITRDVLVTDLRRKLITEEFEELHDELVDWMNGEGSISKIAKEAADLLYVVYGLAVTFRFDLVEAFRRVHESNMSKLGEDGKPIFRADGKVLKGPNYFEPNLEDFDG